MASHLDASFPIKPAQIESQIANYGVGWQICQQALARARLFYPINSLSGGHATSNAQIDVTADFLKQFAELHYDVTIETDKIKPIIHTAVRWSTADFEKVRFPQFQKDFVGMCIAQIRFGYVQPPAPEVTPEILARIEAAEAKVAEQEAALSRMQARLQTEPWYLGQFARMLLNWNMVQTPEDREVLELMARNI